VVHISSRDLCNPAFFDKVFIEDEDEDAEGSQHRKSQGDGHDVSASDQSLHNIHAVGQRQDIGEGPEEDGQFGHGYKQATEEDHRKAEEV
jgi:hypothetical protein